jgi:hypothetical protein
LSPFAPRKDAFVFVSWVNALFRGAKGDNEGQPKVAFRARERVFVNFERMPIVGRRFPSFVLRLRRLPAVFSVFQSLTSLSEPHR